MKNWKRVTPLQNIAFIAMMAAINGALSLLLSFLPYSSFLAIIILPIINALGVYLVDKKWFAVYVVTSIIIPLLVTMFDLSTTLFYVIPSIISGFIYGALSKLRIPACLTILASTIWVLASTYLSLPIIKVIYEIDMIPAVVASLNLKPFSVVLIPSFIFAFSWASTSVSHFLITFTYEKIGFETTVWDWEKYVYPAASIILGTLSILLSSISLEVTYILLALSLYFAAFSVQNLVENHSIISIVALVILLVVAFLAFAFMYGMMAPGAGGSLISLFVIATSISALIASFKAKPLAN